MHLDDFTRADLFHLEAAQGWLGLGDVASANNELDEITPELLEHPAVLLVRCEICSKARQWDAVVQLAERVLQRAPKERQGWIQRSFALHELKRTQEAFEALYPAAVNFPRYWLVPYNLACYCAQLGRLEEARQWLDDAVELGDAKAVKAMALDDPDLAPLRATGSKT